MATLAPMRALLARREQLTKELRQITDDESNVNNDGTLNGEAAAKFAALRALLDELEQSIAARARLDEYDRRAVAVPVLDRADQSFERECERFSITKAISAFLGDVTADGREREIQAEFAKRGLRRGGSITVPLKALSLNGEMRMALNTKGIETRIISTTTPAAGPGSALIPVILDAEQFVDALRPNIVVRALGARVISDQRGYLNLPRLKTPTAPGWFSENSAIPTSDAAFDPVQFRPHHAGVIATWTRDMLQNATPDIEATLRYDMSMQLAREIDYGALAGTGVAPQPLGIIHNAAVPVIASAAASYVLSVDLEASLSGLNALVPNGRYGFVGNSAVRKNFKSLMDNYGRPLGLPLLFFAEEGYENRWTNLLVTTVGTPNTAPLIFGNWSDLVIVMWSELDLLIDPYTQGSSGNVLLRGACTIDTNVRHPESFAYCNVNVT
jgi:HK97 family phage major capsid protein